jgi:hypothetical protein
LIRKDGRVPASSRSSTHVYPAIGQLGRLTTPCKMHKIWARIRLKLHATLPRAMAPQDVKRLLSIVKAGERERQGPATALPFSFVPEDAISSLVRAEGRTLNHPFILSGNVNPFCLVSSFPRAGATVTSPIFCRRLPRGAALLLVLLHARR